MREQTSETPRIGYGQTGPRRFPGIVELARWLHGPLLTNAFYLFCNAGLGTVLGSGFWLLAARTYVPAQVGLASSAASGLLLLATLCDLGLDYAQMRFASERPERASAIASVSFTAGGLATLLGAGVFVAGLGWWSPALRRFDHLAIVLVLFAVLAPAFTVSNLVDAALIAQSRSRLVMVKNLVANALRFPFVLAAIPFGASGLFLSMSAAVALVGLASVPGLAIALPGYRYVPTLNGTVLRELLGYGLKNHVANIVSSGPALLLPLLILNTRGAAQSGYFAVAWLLITPVIMLQSSLSSSLLAEGARRGHMYVEEVRRGIVLIVPAVAFAALLGGALAEPILSIFGSSYAAHGVAVFQLLLASMIPGSINGIFQSRCRIEKRAGELLIVVTASSAITLASVVPLASRWGLAGAGAAFLAGQVIPAGWTGYRVFRPPQSA